MSIILYCMVADHGYWRGGGCNYFVTELFH